MSDALVLDWTDFAAAFDCWMENMPVAEIERELGRLTVALSVQQPPGRLSAGYLALRRRAEMLTLLLNMEGCWQSGTESDESERPNV